jgi:putative transposase
MYLDNQIYFLTAHTYLNQYSLATRFQKQKMLKKIKEFFLLFKYELYAWVILINHYHVLFKTKQGKDLSKCMGKIHAGFTFETNRAERQSGRKIWQNYWDRCIRSEKDFWIHMNYIHHNPVKHGHVLKMEDYEFSSYGYWLKKNGPDWMWSLFQQYTIKDFSISND